MKTVCLLVSTCDKFSDLWDEHFKLLRMHWTGLPWEIYMVTDKPTNKKITGVEIIVAGEDKDFPMRIRYAAERIESDYILLTLDDYFVINDIHSEKLMYLVERSIEENISYLKLYDRKMINPKEYKPINELIPIDMTRKYAITLYPAIWDRRFLINSVKEDMTPWKYEPSLTGYAKDVGAVCMFSHAGLFDILDVVRKGKVLHKANNYFKVNGINIGNREIISRRTEFKLSIMDLISWYMPRRIFIVGKKILKMFGKRFYSED